MLACGNMSFCRVRRAVGRVCRAVERARSISIVQRHVKPKMTRSESAVEKFLSVMDDLRENTSIINLSLEQFNERLLKNDELQFCTAEQLRGLREYAHRQQSVYMKESNDELKYYTAIDVYLENAERKRAIEEEYRYMDTSDKDYEEFFQNMESNRNDEFAIQQEFRDYLEEEEWDTWDIPLHEGKIYQKKDKPLVRWDNVIDARRGDEYRLILLETKLNPHADDIICDKDDTSKYNKCLYVRGKRTMDYIASLKVKELKTQSHFMQRQDKVLLDLVGTKVELIYSARVIKDEIKERFKQLYTKLIVDGYDVNVSYMECHPTFWKRKVTYVTDSPLIRDLCDP